MTADEPLAHGLHQCPTCGHTENTPLFLMWCCHDDEDKGRGIYRDRPKQPKGYIRAYD